jgi:catechol 2,3-dioxygenase-like lactoylglutathione lyase family enzyme
MNVQLDHMILAVNDRDESVSFYTEILGLLYEGEREPFSVLRVTPEFTLQLAPWGTTGGEHLAFAMSRPEFDEMFRTIKDQGIPFGDSFHDVGNMRGPGEEDGARGLGKALYLFDPNRHLVEIRHYDLDG